MEQIQVGYNPVQDRLVLSIKSGDANHKVWLTRRFVMVFLAQLHQTTENDPVVQTQKNTPHREEIMAFQKQQSEVQGKINKSTTPMKQDATDPEPLLAAKVQIEQQTLHVYCTNNGRLSLGLSTGLAYAVINLIEQALKHTGWGFSGVKPAKKKDQDVTVSANWSVSLN